MSSVIEKDYKPVWCNKDTNDNYLLIKIFDIVNWSKTKYFKSNFNYNLKNIEILNLHNKIINKNQDLTIPGIVANEIFDFTKKNKGKGCFHFIPNIEYNSDEIYEYCEGILYGVIFRNDHTITVTYKQYDHHNEPIKTTQFILKMNSKI